MSFLMQRMKTPKGTIAVAMDKNEYSLREPLVGKVNVSASEDFDVDEIRLEVEVFEWTQATQNLNIGGTNRSVTAAQDSKVHEQKMTLQGRMHLNNGFNQDFPFTLNLPTGVPPTYRGRNARCTWKVKGVIAVKGRPDITGHPMELQINY